MNKKLVIVESPNKIKKIQKFLGQEYLVKSSVGHIRDLPPNEMGVSAPNHQPIFRISKGKSNVVKDLKRFAEQASEIYLATDPDREGEAIAWHLSQVLGKRQYKRVVFNEITKAAVTAAINNACQIDFALVKGQTARRVLDRYVGYSVSPLITDREGQKFTAGRVQSPAVRLVVEKKMERDSFNPEDYLVVKIKVNHSERPFVAQLNTKSFVANGELFNDNDVASDASNLAQVTIAVVSKVPKEEKPPAPFITSTMTQAASIRLKMKPKQTMQAAQVLFENGVITYHRTDSTTMAAEAVEAIRDYALEQSLALPDTPHKYSNKADAQEGHEAIRPTSIAVETPAIEAKSDYLRDSAARLYQLIRERAIASQLAVAIYDVTKVALDGDAVSGRQYQYTAMGKVMVQKGWKALTMKDDTDEDDAAGDNKSVSLPALQQGQMFDRVQGKVDKKQTVIPKLYTQAALVKALEAKGIGRPSTYASIMENIENYGYVVEVDKRFIDATDIGVTLYKALVNTFSFVELNYTRDIEKQIDQVVSGRIEYRDMVDSFYNQLQEEMQQISKQARISAVHPCDKCGEPMRRIPGKRKNSAFWGCAAYQSGCKNTWEDDAGKPVNPEHPDFGKQIFKKNNVGNKSSGSAAGHQDGPTCPQCNVGKMVERNGRNGKFLGCSNYPKCKNTGNIG